MKSSRNWLVFIAFLVTAVVLNITTTSFGDSASRLTIINKTGVYLHVYIEGTVYPYVAPDRSVTHSASARETFYVEAFYSPGQGKTSAIVDSMFALPYTPASTYSTGGGECSCEDPNSSWSCSDDEGVVNNPAQGGSAHWEITADMFEENQGD